MDSQRGDLLFLSMPRTAPLALGDITVYKIPGAAIPIVHRVIETHDECVDPTFARSELELTFAVVSLSRKDSNEQWILTKGDNNHADDVGLYNGMRYLKRSNIVGKVQG